MKKNIIIFFIAILIITACSDGNMPPLPKLYPDYNEVELEPVIIKENKFKVIVPKGYEKIGEKHLQDIGYCWDIVPAFLGLKDPYWDGINVKIMISKDGASYGMANQSMGTIKYVRSQENINDDLDDILTNNEAGFFYKSSPVYCANSHEFTHIMTSKMYLPSWAEEGIAEYSQQINQPGSKENIKCLNDGWYGIDYWNDMEEKEFEYSDLSEQYDLLESGEGAKWYATAMCFWQDFDKEFGYKKRQKIFEKLAEEREIIYTDRTPILINDFIKREFQNEKKIEEFLLKFGFEKGIDY